jgi:hypothetical protein
MSAETAIVDDLPMYTHTHVLGCDIGVAQQDTERGVYSGHRTRERAVEVLAYGSDLRADRAHCRRYLAAWARRSLFSPDGDRV